MLSKTCIVVGVGEGIGLAVAKRFAREGYTPVLVARRQEKLEAYAQQLRRELDAPTLTVGLCPADVSDFAALTLALQNAQLQHGNAEVLVYNAVLAQTGRPSTLTPDVLVEGFKVNMAGALAAVQAVLPAMRQAQAGSLLFTGGGLALYPAPDYANLSIGKAGLRNFALALAGELETENIRVATVTVMGYVQPETFFSPDNIAQVFWELHTGERTEREVQYRQG